MQLLTFISNTLLPILLFGGLIVFVGTSVLWYLFKKPYRKFHYGALISIGFGLHLWLMINLLAGGLGLLAASDYVYRTSLPYPALLELIYYSAWLGIGYSFIAWLTVVVRRLLHLNNRVLILWVVWATVLCGGIILWQYAAPCEYTPKGCKTYVGISTELIPL